MRVSYRPELTPCCLRARRPVQADEHRHCAGVQPEPTSGLDSYTANEVCSLQPSPTRCSRAATDALAVTCQHMPAFPDSRGPTLQTHFECLALA